MSRPWVDTCNWWPQFVGLALLLNLTAPACGSLTCASLLLSFSDIFVLLSLFRLQLPYWWKACGRGTILAWGAWGEVGPSSPSSLLLIPHESIMVCPETQIERELHAPIKTTCTPSGYMNCRPWSPLLPGSTVPIFRYCATIVLLLRPVPPISIFTYQLLSPLPPHKCVPTSLIGMTKSKSQQELHTRNSHNTSYIHLKQNKKTQDMK